MTRADEVERAAFEKWVKTHPVLGKPMGPAPFDRDWSDSGEYRGPSIQLSWEVWRARASLPSPTGGGACPTCPECGSDDPKYAEMKARLFWTGENECSGFDFHNTPPSKEAPRG